MIKLIYSLLALLISSAMYLFSSSEVVKVCNQDFSGTVKEVTTEKGKSLVIEGNDHIVYYPKIEDNGVVLLAGTRVKVCFEPCRTMSDSTRLIRIIDVTCLP